MIKVAINGFGRIGRLVYRQLIERKDVEVVAINDLTSPETLLHLLKYDTAHRQFNYFKEVKLTNNAIVVNGTTTPIFAERNPENLPWKKLDVDVVVESTGFFRKLEDAKKHITAGAKKVLISAPGTGEMKTIVYNVNHNILDKNDVVVSAASCTTNCLAPIAKILNDNFEIVKGIMTTVHGYTSDQKLQDAPHADLRRARAAAENIIPTNTGAAIAVGKALPELLGKLDGIAMRVPVITGSVVDLVVELKSNPSVAEINAAMKKAANETLEYAIDPIVSSDIIGSTHGSIYDSLLTREMNVDGKKLYKIISWYDNENSYVSQYVRTLLHLGKLV